MTIPSQFDPIRPFEPEELPQAYDLLLADEMFVGVIQKLYPGVPLAAIEQKMRMQKTNLDFQKAFCYDYLKQLLARASTGCDFDVSRISTQGRYTFVSNHRDIVLDSALLEVLLVESGFDTTCEVAIGDNLLVYPWIRNLLRVNKSFIVERKPAIREMLAASKRLSDYMHFVQAEKHDNVWIAQREGRAKDSDDRTQPSILKMMAMGGEGSVKERLMQLHIVPLAISYEYDPCDYLKAQEFQQKRDNPEWKKSQADDVRSMLVGINGYKGYIHYQAAPCMDEWLSQLPDDTPKGEVFGVIAAEMDRRIFLNYRIYPCNRAAARMQGMDVEATGDELRQFGEYVDSRIALVDMPGKDEAFLRDQLINMYANPLRNHMAAQGQ